MPFPIKFTSAKVLSNTSKGVRYNVLCNLCMLALNTQFFVSLRKEEWKFDTNKLSYCALPSFLYVHNVTHAPAFYKTRLCERKEKKDLCRKIIQRNLQQIFKDFISCYKSHRLAKNEN